MAEQQTPPLVLWQEGKCPPTLALLWPLKCKKSNLKSLQNDHNYNWRTSTCLREWNYKCSLILHQAHQSGLQCVSVRRNVQASESYNSILKAGYLITLMQARKRFFRCFFQKHNITVKRRRPLHEMKAQIFRFFIMNRVKNSYIFYCSFSIFFLTYDLVRHATAYYLR